MKYIDAEKMIAEIGRRREKCADIAADERNEEVAEYYRGKEVAYDETSSLIASLQQEQQVVDYNIVPLPEERMASYIAYCLGREDDDCNCPTCGKHVTGLRLFPYYYDRENNDVYFASVCPECGKIIISKE